MLFLLVKIMHEMSIAQNIIEIVQEIATEKQVKNIKKVIIKIGNLVAVVPDSLQFCYETLTTGTHMATSKLEINIIPILGKCSHCNKTFGVESYFFSCPFCESGNVKIIQGQELNISELEVDE